MNLTLAGGLLLAANAKRVAIIAPPFSSAGNSYSLNPGSLQPNYWSSPFHLIGFLLPFTIHIRDYGNMVQGTWYQRSSIAVATFYIGEVLLP